jgi:hypothetical protein
MELTSMALWHAVLTVQSTIHALAIKTPMIEILRGAGVYRGSSLPDTTVDSGDSRPGVYNGKIRSKHEPHEHVAPRLARYYMSATQHKLSRKQANPMLEAALRVVDVDSENLASESYIARLDVAAGALAMSYRCTQMINDGIAGMAWALMQDGGTMPLGVKFHCAMQSKPKDDGSGGFDSNFIGTMPSTDSTKQGRVNDVFEMYELLMLCLKHLPFFGIDEEAAAGLELSDLLIGNDAFLGDRGERSAAQLLRQTMIEQDLGSPRLKDERLVHFWYCNL